jgi:hypothetical protein
VSTATLASVQGFAFLLKLGRTLLKTEFANMERNLTLHDYSDMAMESELVESHADAPAGENDFTWTCGGDANTKHIKKINHGAFGDVHMVALSKAPS